jgi:single-strand DNA-binding protein
VYVQARLRKGGGEVSRAAGMVKMNMRDDHTGEILRGETQGFECLNDGRRAGGCARFDQAWAIASDEVGGGYSLVAALSGVDLVNAMTDIDDFHSKPPVHKVAGVVTVLRQLSPPTQEEVGMKQSDTTHLNTIQLLGRVSGEATERELPSGDKVVTFRIVVPREESGSDTIDIAAWTGRTRRSALSLVTDQMIRIEGSLRRRFYRASGALVSRYEVEALSIEKLRG